jgi:hypothetical protein
VYSSDRIVNIDSLLIDGIQIIRANWRVPSGVMMTQELGLGRLFGRLQHCVFDRWKQNLVFVIQVKFKWTDGW